MTDGNGGKADLIELLLEDHRAAEALLGQVGADGVDQSDLFDHIVHDLVGHEVAEEEIVYPAVRSSVAGGEALADARIAEQQQAEELLAKMEVMDRTGGEFAASLAHLRDAALSHAKSEEAEVFPKLRAALDAEQLAKLGRAYRAAKEHAPTHPHPRTPNTPPANIAAGSVAAVADGVRDVARSALDKVGPA
jgi:hemerythrin superfamily protein